MNILNPYESNSLNKFNLHNKKLFSYKKKKERKYF